MLQMKNLLTSGVARPLLELKSRSEAREKLHVEIHEAQVRQVELLKGYIDELRKKIEDNAKM